MLDKLTVEDFSRLLQQPFRLTSAEGAFELVLVSAEARGRPVGGGRQPFSLLFRGPRQPVLPQAIHPLVHDALGTLEIFIVPVGANADGVEYEAIFS